MTETEIANLALARLNQDPIVSLEDGSDRGKKVRTIYPAAIATFLAAHEWQFARRIDIPARLDIEPKAYQFAYALPEDCIKLISVSMREKARSFGERDSRRAPVPYEMIGDVVWTDCDRVCLEITTNRVAVSDFPAYATDALAFRVAAELSLVLKNSTARMQEMTQQYQMALSLAIKNDSKNVSVKRLGGVHYADARSW